MDWRSLLLTLLSVWQVTCQEFAGFNDNLLQIDGESNDDQSIKDAVTYDDETVVALPDQSSNANPLVPEKPKQTPFKKGQGAKQKWAAKRQQAKAQAAKNGGDKAGAGGWKQKKRWTQSRQKVDNDGDRSIAGGLIITARRAGNSLQGVRFIQQGPNYIGIKWTDQRLYSSYDVSIKPDDEGIAQTTIDGRRNTVRYDGLKSANVYWVTVKGVRKDSGEYTRAVTIKVFTSPAPPENVRMIDFNDETTVLQWTNPNSHRESCYAVARLAKAPKQIRIQKVNQQENTITIDKMPAGTSYDIMIFYIYNKRRSDTYSYRVTRKPIQLEEINVDKIELVDDGLANAYLSWKWPLDSWWGSVKIEYSPPTPTANHESPFYITNRRIPVRLGKMAKRKRRLPSNSTSIEGLKQGIVYTFGISLTKGPLEGETTLITQGIPETDEFRNVLEPTQLTCRVPLDLNPQELSVRKSLIGEPSLAINWQHPKNKNPEEGYKVVLVPFAESATHLPKIYYVPANAKDNELIITGNDFDPFIEYSVSVVARHNPESYDHENPNGPEFTARMFTGNYVKIDRNIGGENYVMPDSCCRSTLYNSQEKQCCGGTLFDISWGYQCCGWAVYDKTQFMCCKSQVDDPVVKTIEEGCGFGKRIVGSSKRNRARGAQRIKEGKGQKNLQKNKTKKPRKNKKKKKTE